jgi:hypothetical protein
VLSTRQLFARRMRSAGGTRNAGEDVSGAPPLGLTGTSECCVSSGPRVMGSSRRRASARCRTLPRLLSTAVPTALSDGSSSLDRSPLRSSYARAPAPSFRSEPYLPRVLSPLRDLAGCVDPLGGLRPRPGSVLRFSRPLDGLCRARFAERPPLLPRSGFSLFVAVCSPAG